MSADERITMSTVAASPLRNLAWIAGALATSAAVVIGAVLAVVFAATVVVVGFIGSALFGVAAFALRGRKPGKPQADDGLIEARNVGGHSWVAYGWNERP
ncbi:hypothetical protein [Caulobacter segnis]|jgi:hypothetical protein|uniref:hypothetical protein n=1 Tax=Caulobacter segnis TaxID=88688 RepID=UPI001CC02E3B|nr:hypothetical protein [Caulobacter segnis]UAL12004.1 hypothetical protein K8940_06920 [Caulobacter segnis]